MYTYMWMQIQLRAWVCALESSSFGCCFWPNGSGIVSKICTKIDMILQQLQGLWVTVCIKKYLQVTSYLYLYKGSTYEAETEQKYI